MATTNGNGRGSADKHISIANAIVALKTLAEDGTSIKATAAKLSITPHTLSRYRKEFPAVFEDFLNTRKQEARYLASTALLRHLEHLADPALVESSTPTESVRVAELASRIVGLNMQNNGNGNDYNPNDPNNPNPGAAGLVDDMIVLLRRRQWRDKLPPAVQEQLDIEDPETEVVDVSPARTDADS